MSTISPPDLHRPGKILDAHLSSWSARDGYINEEHRVIFEMTKDLPGWQHPRDSEKLYEMAYHSGQVILEIGVYGGRSAVVEIRGALAAWRERGAEGAGPAPQWYGLDVAPESITRSQRVIHAAGLERYALLYHGDLAAFLRDIPIVPTMVFVDGDHRYQGVWSDLNILRDHLADGTPVLCHDYMGPTGVARAVEERVAEGAFEMLGIFGCSALLRCRRSHGPTARACPSETFDATRGALWQHYSERAANTSLRSLRTPVRTLTESIRQQLSAPGERRRASGRAPWPTPDPDSCAMPPAMPNGRPWPRISVVTPSYNQGRYIEDAILSVANQGYPNVEHIVIDGGSRDETLAILKRHRLARVVSEPDDGQSDAINKGMKLATGEILTWLNSDDMLAPGALAGAAIAFHTSGADAVAGVCQVFSDGQMVHQHLTSCDDGPLPLDDLLDIENCWLAGQFFYQPEVMFTRAIWDKTGARLDTTWRYSMDYDLWLRFAEAGARLHVVGRPIAWFRSHDEQKTAETEGGGFRAELPKVREAFLERTGRAWKPRPPAESAGKRPRVVLFNDIGFAYGAGIAHRRMAQALAAGGHEVQALAAMRPHIDTDASCLSADDICKRIAEAHPDLVVIGNVHAASLDPAVVARIAAEFPSACVAHDMWWLTGRCAYTGDCAMYRRGCSERCTCPKGYPELPPERVEGAWLAKRAVLGGTPRPAIWANSDWTLAKVNAALQASGADGGNPRSGRVKFGFEFDVFSPRTKGVCRDLLGLPRDKFLILISASNLNDPRKGISYLANALDRLRLRDTAVVGVGAAWGRSDPPIPGMIHAGYADDPVRLATLFSAADIFVGPSLEEAFGQVFVEAAACGTPSVGFAVGGVPEALLDGISGILAREVSADALADAIGTLHADAGLRASLGFAARVWAENEWSMAASYRSIVQASRACGLPTIGRKINLAVRPTPVPEPERVMPRASRWRWLSGFGRWEGPYPQHNLGRFRWMLGPTSSLEIDVPDTAEYQLVLRVRNMLDGQRVRAARAGVPTAEQPVPITKHDRDHTVTLRLGLTRGANPIEIHRWRWDGRTPERPLSLLLIDATLIGPNGVYPMEVS